MHFFTFADVMAHLDSLGSFHMDLGLGRMERALCGLGLLRARCPVVQVVGTNGKGSTSTFLAAVARAHGVRVGLYTSPHLVHISERIRVDGEPLPEADWPELANTVYAAAPDLTHFEFLTVLAILAFDRAGVQCIILEAGLGGHHDATTAMAADLVCFTPIALDHMQVLGPDLEHIATDKAHAMRPGVPAVTAPQEPEVMACLRSMAQVCGCILHESQPLVCVPVAGCADKMPQTWMVAQKQGAAHGAFVADQPFRLGLSGVHQHINAGLAFDVWQLLANQQGWVSRPEAVCTGLRTAFIAGRLQTVAATAAHPPLILDGAHNAHGLSSLAADLEARGVVPCALIFTCLADKDSAAMLPIVHRLAGLGAHVSGRAGCPILVPDLPGNIRSRSGAALAAELGATARAVPDMQTALAMAAALSRTCADSAPVIICGSLYLLGEFFQLYPNCLQKPEQNS